MAIVGFHCQRGYRTHDECISCPSRCIVAAPVLEQRNKAAKGYYASREHEYHVTSLLGCPRKAVLGRMCGEYVPPINMWKMTMGTLCHSMMEHNQQGIGVAERQLNYRYYVDVPGNKGGMRKIGALVVGRFDWYDKENRLLTDYKFIWTLDYMPNLKHYQQMAVYYIIGLKSGAFVPEDVVGAQINYIDATTGTPFVYKAEGKVFYDAVEDMKIYVPKMLEYYVKSNEEGVVPEGDMDKKECAYCPHEFRAFCAPYKRLGKSECSAVVLVSAIEGYRRDNTKELEDFPPI